MGRANEDRYAPGHDRGEPGGAFVGVELGEYGFHDRKTGIDDAEEGFQAGEEGDEAVD